MPDLRDLRGRPLGRPDARDPRDPRGTGDPRDPRDLRGFRRTGPEAAEGRPQPDARDGQPAGPPTATPRNVHRTRAEERIAELDVSPSKLTAEIERLTGELDAAKQRADEFLAGLQRERAEFSNFRRRTTEEREAMLGLAGEDLIRKVLAIADDFDLAIDNRPADLEGNSWVEGVTAIDRKLRALLESEGVKTVAAEAGQVFDPREHEAIANVPGTGRAEGEIVDVVRRGYKLRDRVLRPALVAVAAAPEPTADADTGARAN
jgi:molecular chaperone GrpE